jgi:hypothetical protein
MELSVNLVIPKEKEERVRILKSIIFAVQARSLRNLRTKICGGRYDVSAPALTVRVEVVMPKETILLLDTEPNIQWTLKTFLEGEKYLVQTVSSIEGALKSFKESKISALITEYWIDDSSTLETIRVFKRFS